MNYEINYIFDPENTSDALKLPGPDLLSRGALAPGGINLTQFAGKKAAAIHISAEADGPNTPDVSCGLIEFDEKGGLHPDILSFLAEAVELKENDQKLQELDVKYRSRWNWEPGEDVLEHFITEFLSKDMLVLMLQKKHKAPTTDFVIIKDDLEPIVWSQMRFNDFFGRKSKAGIEGGARQTVTVIAVTSRISDQGQILSAPIVGSHFQLDENGLPTEELLETHLEITRDLLACSNKEEVTSIGERIVTELNTPLDEETVTKAFALVFNRAPDADEMKLAMASHTKLEIN
ncbi:hypothetical protein [Desulfoluna butyratoxydans]|uniref:Uncharacterized protein n=1 Tax=Desulfoluna butyratoxydans TaxID=231438 RepID=A0A4U8YJE2_9BACT|nr:hypothetical protein [Desulfoluna butyratoxydans]VFQ43865.1 hypothetical protein MSL71_15070 [Desulfoluna butyratoxydans]